MCRSFFLVAIRVSVFFDDVRAGDGEHRCGRGRASVLSRTNPAELPPGRLDRRDGKPAADVRVRPDAGCLGRQNNGLRSGSEEGVLA